MNRFTRLARDSAQLVAMMAVVLVVRSTVAAPYYVPSESMLPTLQVGDRMFVTKFAYGWSRFALPVQPAGMPGGRIWNAPVRRGDVVVFSHPTRDEPWVKRAIGLPGDVVELRRGQVFLNGSAVPRRRMGTKEIDIGGRMHTAVEWREDLPGAARPHEMVQLERGGRLSEFGPVTVPAGNIFVMGDNRDNSADGRVPLAEGGVGMLPVDHLLGRVDRMIFSPASGHLLTPIE